MKNLIPDPILDEIRLRADIVEVVGAHVSLKQSGQNFKGLCPFHQEKTPSFTVNQDKRIYHCFGCGAGGNVYRFLMELEGLSFVDAVKKLANDYQVALPKQNAKNIKELNQKEVVWNINEQALAFFQTNWQSPSGQVAQKYLDSRAFCGTKRDKFQLGWVPDEWSSLIKSFESSKAFSKEQLVDAGLVAKKENGPDHTSFYDRFRGRIIFPIRDVSGRLIGFGGRALGDAEPKYLNSPETLVYKKGEGLFGLFGAKETIRKKDQVLIVEGYFDQIQVHDSGLKNVVATCGTALTPTQANLLRRFTKNAVLVFDSDSAGQNASAKAYHVLTEQGFAVRILTMPPKQDPDSYIIKEGAHAFQALLDQSRPFVEEWIDKTIEAGDTNDLSGKLTCINRLMPFIVPVKNGVEKGEYLRQLAEKLNVDDKMLLGEMKKSLTEGRSTVDIKSEQKSKAALLSPERCLLRLILTDQSVYPEVRKSIGAEEFSDHQYREVASLIFTQESPSEMVSVDKLIEQSQSEEIRSLLSAMSLEPLALDDSSRAISELIAKIKKRSKKDDIQILKEQRRTAFQNGEVEKSREIHLKVQEILHQEQ